MTSIRHPCLACPCTQAEYAPIAVLFCVLTALPEQPTTHSREEALHDRVCARLPVPHVVFQAPHDVHAFQKPVTLSEWLGLLTERR